MFRNALAQNRNAGREGTGEGAPSIRGAIDGANGGRISQEMNWRAMLSRAVSEARWNVIETDVRAFIEDPDSLLAFTQENLLRLVG